MRATGRFAVAVLVASTLPASAAAKEEVLYLPGTGLQAKIECTVCAVDRSDLRKDRAGREFGTDTLDLMIGEQSIQYQLALMPKGEGEVSLCDDPVAGIERLQGARIARPAWLPTAIRPQVIENREGGRYRLAACADVPGGALFATVRVVEPGASPTAEARRRIGQTLERLVAAARPSRVELKKFKAAADLPLLAGNWRADKAPETFRLDERRAVHFETEPGTCADLLPGEKRSRPSFLPTSYYEQVGTKGLDGRPGRYVLCLEGAHAILAEVDGPLSAGSPDDKRVAMLLEALGAKLLPSTADRGTIALPTSGLVLISTVEKEKRWVRTGEGDAPTGKADLLALPGNDKIQAAVHFSPGPCVAPGQEFREAPDHLEWLQWRRENGPLAQHWCTPLYRGNVTVTLTRPPAATEGDDAMYELLRASLAAAQRKVGLVPATGLAASIFPAVGLIADLPRGWTVRDGGNDEDFAESGPRGDGSRLALARLPGSCDEYFSQLVAKGAVEAPNDKFAAPAGWNARRLLEGGRTVHACHAVPGDGSLIARLVPGRTDAGATWTAVTPLLESLAKKAGDLVASDR
jgi:hypothetical protein